MINILIVDDDSIKIKDVCAIIQEFSEIPSTNIEYELEVKKAYDKLQVRQYDLVILDIKLPEIMGKMTIDNGGIDLLEAIHTTERIKKPSHIIGLSSHDKLIGTHEQAFSKLSWALLKYNKKTTDWKEQIRNKIRYIIEWKKRIIEEIKFNVEYDYDYAIITAVETEYKSVLDLDIEWTMANVDNDGTQYKRGIIKNKDNEYKIVVAKQHQMGMPAASVLSMKLIQNFKPKYLFMTGIAGGKKGKVNHGDIIVAAESWDYGSGKIKGTSGDNNTYLFEPAPHQIPIDTRIKEFLGSDFSTILYQIRRKWNKTASKEILQDIKIHVGAFASGAAVIQNEKVVADFIDPHNRNLLGLDMETYAVYYAAENCISPKPKFLSMKAVCDFADSDKNDDYQAYSAYVSAQFFYHLLCNTDLTK